MRKLFIAALIIAASFSLSLAQSQQGSSTSGKDDIPNMGHAPTEPNGIGRLDLRVVDENGNPVNGPFATLESRRTHAFSCESCSPTNDRRLAVPPPIHMGKLLPIVKAKAYQTIKIAVPTDSLSQPV